MAIVLHTFDEPIERREDGASILYRARACGRETEGGRWEGWVEFAPEDPTEEPVLRSERETTQPDRKAIEYWATGISPVYLEGSLERALRPKKPVKAAPPERPAYAGPAPSSSEASRPTPSSALIDPFSVYRKGEELLRRELGALEAWHLRNVVRAYDLADERRADLETLSRPELVELIVDAVGRQSG